MAQSFSITLQQLRFFANHGLYEGEETAGNEFEVNIEMKLADATKKELELTDTINYARAYEIVRLRMEQRFGLLENLAIAIADDLESAFPQCSSLAIEIKKLHPPIPSFKGAVGITYNRQIRSAS